MILRCRFWHSQGNRSSYRRFTLFAAVLVAVTVLQMRLAFRVAPWVVPAVPVSGFLHVAYVVDHKILNVLDKRLRTDAARRYKRVDRAIAVIWKMLMVAERHCRRPLGAGTEEGCLAR